MCRFAPLLILCGLAACGAPADEPGNAAVDVPVPSGPPVIQQAEAEVPDTSLPVQGLHWESVSGGDGAGLRLIAPNGGLVMSLSCRPGSGQLVAQVPGFSAIGSEDRFSLAVGEEPVTLVADPTRQAETGVAAEGPAPEDFADLLGKAQRIGALYGTQRIEPQEAPPERQLRAFAESCEL